MGHTVGAPLGPPVRFVLATVAIILSLLVAKSALSETADDSALAGPAGESRVIGCHHEVWYAVQEIQPWYKRAASPEDRSLRVQHLRDLTEGICEASKVYRIDPLLAVAVAFRESSLLPLVGLGTKNGARGERGYFQVMPGGPAERFTPEGCESQCEPRCNAHAALGYMAYLRGHSDPQSPWVWLGGYGRSTGLPSVEEAREFEELRFARRLYCELREECEEVWPE